MRHILIKFITKYSLIKLQGISLAQKKYPRINLINLITTKIKNINLLRQSKITTGQKINNKK